jgi:hypothetical protein
MPPTALAPAAEPPATTHRPQSPLRPSSNHCPRLFVRPQNVADPINDIVGGVMDSSAARLQTYFRQSSMAEVGPMPC